MPPTASGFEGQGPSPDLHNGYWWGEGDEKVDNPWAILNCRDDARFGQYWWALA